MSANKEKDNMPAASDEDSRSQVSGQEEESQRDRHIADDSGSGAASHRSAPSKEDIDVDVKSDKS